MESEPHYYEVARYVVLNPVRAGIVARPGDWPWSSHAAVLGRVPSPAWLAVERILGAFDGRRDRYAEFVDEGVAGPPMDWRGVGRAV